MSTDRHTSRLDQMEARLSRLEELAGLKPVRPSETTTPALVERLAVARDPVVSAALATSAPAVQSGTVAPIDRPPPLPPQPPHSLPPIERPTVVGAARSDGPDDIVDANVPTSRPSRASTRPSALTTSGPAADFERFVGVSILGRVGVAALLLAAAYFAQWTYQRIGPVEKVASLYAMAGVLVGLGLWLRPRVSRVYLGILWGGGVAAAYMAGFVARATYGLVDPFTATAMLAGACVLGQGLARRAQMQTLALVSILGAAAAPVLVGSRVDARTSLLVYLLAIHGWSAWTERRWGWSGARLVGLVSTGVVALLWLGEHGRSDVSTFVHVHAYLLGWTAPEWGSALAGRAPGKARSIVLASLLAFAEATALVPAWDSGEEALRRGFAVVTAAMWGAIAVGARLRTSEPSALVKGLSRIAGALLVIGAITVLDERGLPMVFVERYGLLAVTAAGLLAFSGRSLLRVGEGAATLASVIGLGFAGRLARSVPDPWAAVALVIPLVLLLRGSLGAWRVVGVCLAAVAPFVALGDVWGTNAWWLVAAFGASAAVVSGSVLRSSRRGDTVVVTTATLLSIGLAAAWAACAQQGPLLPLPAVLANPGTAAAAIALAGLVLVWRGQPTRASSARADGLRPLVGGVFLAALLAAVWREVHDVALRMTPRDLGTVVETATLVGYGGVLAFLGRRRLSVGLSAASAVAYGIASLFVLGTVGGGGGPWTAAAQVILLAIPATLGATRRAPADVAASRVVTQFRVAACAMLAVAATAWIVAWSAGRFGGAAAVVNARLLSGVLLVAGLVLARRSMPRDAWPVLAPLLAAGASALSLVVGIGEVVNVVNGVEQGPWRRVLVSVYATLHCAAILAIGFRSKDALLRWLAIGGLAAVVGKVGLFDLSSGVPTELRVLVTACLGAVLLACAYAYARRARLATGMLAVAAGDAAAGEDER